MLPEEGGFFFSPELAAGTYRSPFCTSSRGGADRRWGFGACLSGLQEMGRLSPPESVTGF